RVALGPLSDDAARALLAAHTARHPMTDAAIARALEDGRGNAFLLEFLARHTPRDGGDGAVEVGSALGAALDGLDRDARVLFECVSLAQHPVPLATLGRVLADRARLRGHTAHLAAECQISHLEGSGQRDAAARASITAGHAAAARYAFEIAAAYFTKALALGELAP